MSPIRSGFVALAGRPNVGKSTLLNSIVGEKVAIVDLPGVQRPRDPLTERMQRRMERELSESDAALFVLNGQQGAGPGDRFIAAAIRNAGVPCVIALNKIDVLNREQTVAALEQAAELDLGDTEIFPVSALRGAGVPEVVAELLKHMPEG